MPNFDPEIHGIKTENIWDKGMARVCLNYGNRWMVLRSVCFECGVGKYGAACRVNPNVGITDKFLPLMPWPGLCDAK